MSDIKNTPAPFLAVVGRVFAEGEETMTFTNCTPEEASARFIGRMRELYEDPQAEVYIHAVFVADSRIFTAISNY